MATYHPSWQPLFDEYEFDLKTIFEDEAGLPVYPPKEQVFNTFSIPVTEIKVVLLGQDPYHGPGQAHGLSFSVPNGVPPPPSLQNIFKELQTEYPERKYKFSSGNLQRWVEEEKIMLLNASLTVRQALPNSHVEVWKEFTDDVIRFIAKNNTTCVFLLLGAFAQKKAEFIDKTRTVKGVHPSPLAAHKGFFGSGIFKKVEESVGPINWSV